MADREKLAGLILASPLMQQARGSGKRLAIAFNLADHLLANGVVVREKGEWILTDARFAEMSCSLCGFTYYGEYGKECMSNFCPQCGSDMRGDNV